MIQAQMGPWEEEVLEVGALTSEGRWAVWDCGKRGRMRAGILKRLQVMRSSKVRLVILVLQLADVRLRCARAISSALGDSRLCL